MTERKPPGKTFTSWIDQQIAEAAERGAFDDLPLAGKPLPRRPESDDGTGWIRDKLAREGISAEELLPPPLKLRKQRQRLLESAGEFRTEREVIDAVSELNHRIAEWRRIPVGPPIHVALVDKDEMLGRWRESRAAVAAAERSQARNGPEQTAHAQSARPGRRWWPLRSRPQRG